MKTSSLNAGIDWPLDCKILLKDWEKMSPKQQQRLQQLTLQYGCWIHASKLEKSNWLDLERYILREEWEKEVKERWLLGLAEMRIFGAWEDSFKESIAFLQMTRVSVGKKTSERVS